MSRYECSVCKAVKDDSSAEQWLVCDECVDEIAKGDDYDDDDDSWGSGDETDTSDDYDDPYGLDDEDETDTEDEDYDYNEGYLSAPLPSTTPPQETPLPRSVTILMLVLLTTAAVSIGYILATIR